MEALLNNKRVYFVTLSESEESIKYYEIVQGSLRNPE
jgi:hypothetical protein